jgi:hypothetical protein
VRVQTPSHNIRCVAAADEDALTCRLLRSTKGPYRFAFRLGPRGLPARLRSVRVPPGGRVLRYGTTWTYGGIQCRSRKSGLRCIHIVSHCGFFLSRESQRRWCGNEPTTKRGAPRRCAASYRPLCIAPPPPDRDCADVPYRDFRVRWNVRNPDPHHFDSDNDGIGCESMGPRWTSSTALSSSIHPTRHTGRALFRTPSNAAYCWLARTLAPENPVIGCWTPNDGFYSTIQYARGFRGQAGYQARRRFEGFTPGGYPLLRFGQNFQWRCRKFNERIGLAEDCSRRVGKVAFSCRSRRTGLTCRNRHGHGFWLGRFRGYRLF